MSCFYIEDDKYKTCTSNIIFVLAERRCVPKKFSLRGLAWGVKRESTVQERLAVVGDSDKLLAVRNYLLAPRGLKGNHLEVFFSSDPYAFKL